MAELRSLWPSGEICPGSRERMLEGAFRIEMRASRPPADIIAGFLLEEHTLPIQRVVAGMSLSDLQIYVCQRWEEMFKAYKAKEYKGGDLCQGFDCFGTSVYHQ